MSASTDETEPRKSITLSFRKAYFVGSGGTYDPKKKIDDAFTVVSITGSMSWMPGERLDALQIQTLIDDSCWTVTIQ